MRDQPAFEAGLLSVGVDLDVCRKKNLLPVSATCKSARVGVSSSASCNASFALRTKESEGISPLKRE